MKRTYTERKTHKKTGDIKRDLSPEQLAGIGAIALAYNYAESSIDRALGLALGVGHKLYLPLVTRIGGMDGKIDLLKLAATDAKLPSELCDDLAESLGYFSTLKGFRDGIIHARVLDSALGLGEVVERRARHSEVLLTKDALNGLYDHLNAIATELACWILIWYQIRQLMNREADDPAREQFAEALLDGCSQYQSRRNERRSLPPLPKFPSESELAEAWAQARVVEEMAWFQPLSQPHQRSGLSEAVRSTVGTQGSPAPLTSKPPQEEKG